uniref:Uncharacterized protein n=1 Tax=Rhizophora mucronata TaxID=61149 RepID=A0A2P2MV05_RHIMU
MRALFQKNGVHSSVPLGFCSSSETTRQLVYLRLNSH